ncbi:unnamed protein product [Lampetra planeri]
MRNLGTKELDYTWGVTLPRERCARTVATDQRARGIDLPQSRSEDWWREVVNRLDLLLVTIDQLITKLSASAPANQGMRRELRGSPELPTTAAVPAAETTQLPPAISPVEGMAWPASTIWSGMRDNANAALQGRLLIILHDRQEDPQLLHQR